MKKQGEAGEIARKEEDREIHRGDRQGDMQTGINSER